MTNVLRAALISGLLATAIPFPCQGDGVPYRAKKTISTTNGDLYAVHKHDWGSAKLQKLAADSENGGWSFSKENDFSFVELHRTEGNVLFRRPSPALTQIYVSNERKLLVGLSTIMLNNPFQLVVWDERGDVIHSEHITDLVAKLGPGGDEALYNKFPSAKEILKKHMFVYNGTLYCDFNLNNMSKRIGKDAWSYLFDRRVGHPYSDDFRESVTNSIIWYDEMNPQIKLESNGAGLFLNLRSPNGRVMRIPIARTNAKK